MWCGQLRNHIIQSYQWSHWVRTDCTGLHGTPGGSPVRCCNPPPPAPPACPRPVRRWCCGSDQYDLSPPHRHHHHISSTTVITAHARAQVADMAVMQDKHKLVGCSYHQSFVGLWVVDLKEVRLA